MVFNHVLSQAEVAKLSPSDTAAYIAWMTQRNTELEVLAASKKNAVTVKISEYGSGTLSVYGINRFPISVYPEQISELEKVIPELKRMATAYHDQLRCAAFASEAVKKAGIKWDSTPGATNQSYKETYSTYFLQAKVNPKLMSARDAKRFTPSAVVSVPAK